LKLNPEPADPKYAKRLTREQAEAVREAKANEWTYAEIKEEFGICKQAAINIVKGRTHREVEARQ
jgi:predicted DNA-binding protein YlxM (UPF0122 family)